MDENTIEMWKEVKDHDGIYSVSNLGRVRNNNTGKILGGDINSCGYRRVMLGSDRWFVHRLVATYFVENKMGTKK